MKQSKYELKELDCNQYFQFSQNSSSGFRSVSNLLNDFSRFLVTLKAVLLFPLSPFLLRSVQLYNRIALFSKLSVTKGTI